jgi:predicted MFS family arabinose efflux permease
MTGMDSMMEAIAALIAFGVQAGRLVGTLLSGIVFQWAGLIGALWVSAAFVLTAAVLSLLLHVPVRMDPGR